MQPHEGMPEHPARADERRALWAEQDRLLHDIRADPRFANFLRPDPLGHDRPPTGAAILINAGPARGDAVILRPGGDPEHIALDDFTSAAALAAAQLVREADDVGNVLGWLWDKVVEPILAVAAPADAGKSRIWWLPVGPIGGLPFHAAGHPGRPGALHRVVSSYAPTLQALAYSRARPAAGTRRQLVVGPVRAPGDANLPAARLEVADLSAREPGARSLMDDEARVEDVLRALPEATWVHFACHAEADPVAPSRSNLRLYEGKLPVARIGRLDLACADLAYLSACSTMDAWSRSADESLHLAGAFQLAGFRHVVATLWPLNDELARRAARMFYDRLTDPDQAAETLNHVTLELRNSLPNRPDAWATLVHSGP
ncbi:CHAT domain-containing protein [Paractinoplanes globisporus]|uniref:CHAT domain-containing protein n=1 Tax=Paractinoplanes globisporus TaxID=113565 RepID=A0ABW6WAP3_9ACTN|nr:CHAT domain-containing protein [Actinoplanes globisporus]